ncbi:MAG: efflux RND transporter permease subunit, partial [bacterium]
MALVPGVTDLMVEPQVIIPQLRVEIDRGQLKQLGLQVNDVNEYVQTAMNGKVASEVMDGMRTFDLTVRMQETYREDINALRRLPIQLPEGGTVPLGTVARIY